MLYIYKVCADLHRSFFARAISDHPKDPLGSPYGTSVIAAYRSAGSLVALMRNLHGQLTDLSERVWFLWTHMFSCAVSSAWMIVTDNWLIQHINRSYLAQ